MIIPSIVNDEIVIEGEMQEGDRIPGLCCAGYDWVVSTILSSVWGNCDNPNCPAYDMNIGPEDHYRGVSYKDVYDIAEWILDHPSSEDSITCSECKLPSPGGLFYFTNAPWGERHFCGSCVEKYM